MSEEEIIGRLKRIIKIAYSKEFTTFELTYQDVDAIQGLLDLYNTEKEKNRQCKMRIEQLENEITARIEDVNKNYISKDKIREYIKENKRIYEMKTPNRNRVIYKDCVLLTREVKELLEEK